MSPSTKSKVISCLAWSPTGHHIASSSAEMAFVLNWVTGFHIAQLSIPLNPHDLQPDVFHPRRLEPNEGLF